MLIHSRLAEPVLRKYQTRLIMQNDKRWRPAEQAGGLMRQDFTAEMQRCGEYEGCFGCGLRACAAGGVGAAEKAED